MYLCIIPLFPIRLTIHSHLQSYKGPTPTVYAKDNAVWAINEATSTTKSTKAHVLDKVCRDLLMQLRTANFTND